MSQFGPRIRPYVDAELQAAANAEAPGDATTAFSHMERARVLGQASTVQHVQVHWRMFLWGLHQRSFRECSGQMLRIAGAASKTFVGLVPHGNTGGTNVSPVKPMRVPPELQAIIEEAGTR